MPPTVHIFISYSHHDARWKDRLVSQLGILQNEGLLTVWHDGLIQPGIDWLPMIETAMAEAHIAILIVSAAFLNSAFIRRKEIPALMTRRKKEGLRLIPLIASPCPYQRVPWLAAIHAHPPQGKTLAELGGVRAEKVLSELAEEILSYETLSSNATGSGQPDSLLPRPTQGTPASASRSVDEIDALVPTSIIEFAEPVVGFDILPHGQGLIVCHPGEGLLFTNWGQIPREARKIGFDNEEVTSCALSADGMLLAVGDGFASISVYEVRTGKKVKSFRRRASGTEIKRFRELGLRESSFEYGDLTFSPDGRYLAACRRVASRDQGRISYPYKIKPMDTPVDIYCLDGKFKERIPGYGCYPFARFTRDSQYIIVGLERNDDDNLAVYAVNSGEKKYSMYLDDFVRCVITHPDGEQIIASLGGSDQRAIRFLSVASGRERKALSYSAIPDDGRYPCADSMCIDTAGHYLASAHNCGVLRLWDVRRDILMLTWLTNTRGLWVNKLLCDHSDGSLLASLRHLSEDTGNTVAMVRMTDLLMRAESPHQ